MGLQPVRKIPASRLANKAEAAEWFDVSIPTLDAWLRRGAPYVARGGRGQQWQLDLRDVAEWYYGRHADLAGVENPDSLPPKERLDWYRGTRERTVHLREIGELVPAVEYERSLAKIVKALANRLESLPDLLERHANLDGSSVDRVIAAVDEMRQQLYEAMAGE